MAMMMTRTTVTEGFDKSSDDMAGPYRLVDRLCSNYIVMRHVAAFCPTIVTQRLVATSFKPCSLENTACAYTATETQ